MLHKVEVSHNHVKDVSSTGFHLAPDKDALAIRHYNTQLSLSGRRFPFLWLQK